ncbi:MAG TPA: hypothetical protein VKG23_04020 [Thermoanaerobaculia bacterium]|nr:hypothetical protein [Thermoanaerobaculia bacterium]
MSAAPASSRIEVPEGVVEVVVDGRPALLSDSDVFAWVERAARAVAAYYGRYPVTHAIVTVHGGGPGKISSGRTIGVRGIARIGISVGDKATPEDLKTNWELVHEMVHLAFPSMDGDPWIEEGLATYVEPLVRVRAGLASTDEIWKWLVWGLPKGQDAVASRGVDAARTWAATYWGGALFAFEADLEIRRRTENRKSLDDALRGIVLAGGNVTESWSLSKAFEVGDRAAGVPVLTELYAKMRKPFAPFDLDETFRRLGVKTTGLGISYDDAAPLAAIRRGITTGK